MALLQWWDSHRHALVLQLFAALVLGRLEILHLSTSARRTSSKSSPSGPRSTHALILLILIVVQIVQEVLGQDVHEIFLGVDADLHQHLGADRRLHACSAFSEQQLYATGLNNSCGPREGESPSASHLPSYNTSLMDTRHHHRWCHDSISQSPNLNATIGGAMIL